jgi:hypothetical protein
MKKKLSIGYQWFYDVDVKDIKVVTDIIGSCKISSHRQCKKYFKTAFSNNGFEPAEANEAAVYEIILIRKEIVKRK